MRNSGTVGSSTIADWGQAGDTPLAGDFDGDGKADMVVFRPSTGHWYVRNVGNFDWGIDGDIPVIWHP